MQHLSWFLPRPWITQPLHLKWRLNLHFVFDDEGPLWDDKYLLMKTGKQIIWWEWCEPTWPRVHVSTCPGVVWSQTRRCRRLAASCRCCPIPSLCIITDMLSDNARCCCTLLHKNSSPTGAHPASSWEVPVTPQPLSSLLTPQPSPAIELETKVHPKVRNHGEGPY